MSTGTIKLAERIASGFRWRVLPECQDLLFGPDGLRLGEWLREGLAQVVKHGPHRTVYRVTLPSLSFYVKHYRLADSRAWLRQLVRPPKARIEFDRALAVAARDVSTVIPLGLGEECQRPGDSFLITRGLDGSQSLDSFIECTLPDFEPFRQTRIRQRLARALGRFVAGLHNAGIVHHDLHAANVLVDLRGDEPCLHLVDLHDVHLGRPLSWRRSAQNLILLNRWFAIRASRADRRRFWNAYCEARTSAAGPSLGGQTPTDSPAKRRHLIRDLARELERDTWKSNLRFWLSRDRRCLVNNRYYTCVKSGDLSGYAVRDLDSEILKGILSDPEAVFGRPDVRLLKDSRGSTVAELDIVLDGVCRPMIYKRFRMAKWTDPWFGLVRRSAALRSWIHGHGLRERCLRTARPLAILHRRTGPFVREAYLLTERITDAVDLREFLLRLDPGNQPADRTVLRRRIEQTARLICELHRRQLSHRDLKAGNLLVTEDAVWLIDLVGVTPFRVFPRGRRIQNLGRLHASFYRNPRLTRTDKLRFLRTYLRWGLFGRQGWKDWWKAIEQQTQIKVARNARMGRPLA